MIRQVCCTGLALMLSATSSLSLAGGKPQVLEIFVVQGAGLQSPFVNEVVSIPDSTVTAVLADGFFLQTPDDRSDKEAALTSNGLRIMTVGSPTYANSSPVTVGHRVTVTGTVLEVGTETRLSVTQPPIRIGTTTVPLPTASELSFAAGKPRARPDNLYCGDAVTNFECFEGMLVHLPEGRVVSGNATSSTDNFGPVFISPFGERSLREKGVRFGDSVVPGNELAGNWDGNPEILRMDADRLGAVSAGTAIAGGAGFSATGVLTMTDGDYVLWPTSLNLAANNQLPTPLPVQASSDVLRIASFDLTALCDAVAGNTPQPCMSPEPSASELAVQLSRLSEYIGLVLGSPEVVALQHVENAGVLAQLAAQVEALTPGSVYVGLLVEGSNPRGLDLAFLVDVSRVSDATATVLAAGEIDPTQGGGQALHPMPPLLLSGSFTAPGSGAFQAFRVLNVHVAERTGVDAGTGSIRERRFAQAHSIAELIQEMQLDGQGMTAPLMVAGKLNAWSWTDGYVDVLGLLTGVYFNPENLINLEPFNVVSPLLFNSHMLTPEFDRVTAVGVESFGAIQGAPDRKVGVGMAMDHILLTTVAQQILTANGIGRGNADAALHLRRLGTDSVGSSNFDAVVVDVDPGCRDDPAQNEDGDIWCDLMDNCPSVANDDQFDSNGDGIGDACDAGDTIFANGFEG